MALTLALPLFGLQLEHFSALSTKLLCDQNLTNLPDSGRASPSAESESSGVGSFIGSGELPGELMLVPSRPESPSEPAYRSHEKREEKNTPLRVVYGERDILNLGANIREPFWQIRDPVWFPYENNPTFNRSIYYEPYEQTFIDGYTTKSCNDCGFYELAPNLFLTSTVTK